MSDDHEEFRNYYPATNIITTPTETIGISTPTETTIVTTPVDQTGINFGRCDLCGRELKGVIYYQGYKICPFCYKDLEK